MHSVEGADHVGAFLREARETTGRSVADVAHALRIRRVYLQAIEDGRFDELPGAAYAVGFVRSYATYLRLDAPTLVERFKEEASGIQSPQELDFPTPLPEGRFPGGIVVALCLILGAGIFGGWYWYQSQNGIEVARIPPPPADLGRTDGQAPAVTEAPDAPSPAVAEMAEPVEQMAATEPAIETPVVETPAVEQPETAPVPVAPVIRSTTQVPGSVLAVEAPSAPTPIATETQTARLPTAPAPPADVSDNGNGRTYGTVNQDARIVLSALENTWVQVRDTEENVVLTQMLRAGDRYLVPNRSGLRLMTGNAGGLNISVDGEQVPPIGARGESRRDVRLDTNLLKTGEAVIR